MALTIRTLRGSDLSPVTTSRSASGGCCGQSARNGLGDPIMMLEGLGASLVSPSLVVEEETTSLPFLLQRQAFVPTSDEAPPPGGAPSAGVVAPSSGVAVPVPPPVEEPKDNSMKIAIAVGGVFVVAALVMRGR